MLARTPAPIRLRVHMGFAGKTYDLNVGTPAWTGNDAKRDIRTVALIPPMCQQLFFGMTELTDDELPLASIEGFDRGEAMDLQLIIKTGPKWAEEERLILDKIKENPSWSELAIDSHVAVWHLPAELGRLSNLEKLKISCCSQLWTLPPELGHLQRLKKLEIVTCAQLSDLPAEVRHLQSLRSLIIKDCDWLERLPEELCELGCLLHITLEGCRWLRTLPDNFGNLDRLFSLHIEGCCRLQILPDHIGNLGRLWSLHIEYAASVSESCRNTSATGKACRNRSASFVVYRILLLQGAGR